MSLTHFKIVLALSTGHRYMDILCLLTAISLSFFMHACIYVRIYLQFSLLAAFISLNMKKILRASIKS